MKNYKRTLVIGAIICGLSMVLVSCQLLPFGRKTASKSTATKGLVETPSIKHYQAPDVPVPANFVHCPQDSFVYISGSVRTCGIKYVGSARTDDLMEFYRRQMSQFGWMEKMTIGIDSKKAIAFKKDNEKCEIEIEQKPSETLLVVKIRFNE